MSRRNRGGEEIRGPNSALTEFLRSQGINANMIRERHLERQRLAEQERENAEQEGEEMDEEDETEAQQAGEDEVVERIIRAGRRKRRSNDDPDYADANEVEAGDTEGVEFCARCKCRFTVTVYTVQTPEGMICRACSNANKKARKSSDAQQSAKRQRRKVAEALLNKKDFHQVTKLQDFCIGTVVKYIDDVEALGDVGTVNFAKIARIVCRNRRLNNITLKLFLEPGSRNLELWDCSSLTDDAYNLIPAFCPNIESLTLGMCGQLHDSNLLYMVEKLPKLTKLWLDGPFLIRKNTWMSVLADIGPRLTELRISSTHRVDNEVLAFLVETCPNLVSLSLSKISGLDGDAGMHLFANLTNLKHLELSYLDELEQLEPVVTDDALITILNKIGSQLESLVLNGSSNLSDRTIVSGIKSCCGSLQKLELGLLDQVTDEALAKLFTRWTVNRGLSTISLQRCIGVGDEGLSAMLKHSASTLVELNINSLQLVTKESLELLTKLSNLTTLNIGFVRATDDALVESVDSACQHLSLIEVHGDPDVTDACIVKPGCRLIGRQSDFL